ncbi:MAG: efflux RND transporter permease subunit, partial [Thermodesulfobacteriota bacterium]
RRQVNDLAPNLPPGVKTPVVNDDWGDEYGVFYALTGDGYTLSELEDFAEILKRELLLVKDVASVELWGDRTEVVNIEMSKARMAKFGVSVQQVVDTLNSRNMVADAGRVKVAGDYVHIRPTGDFTSVSDMEKLLVTSNRQGDLVRLEDIATVSKGCLDPPQWIMRHNGEDALGIGVASVSDGNVVTMGKAVEKRIHELKDQAPVGMELDSIAFQSDTVSKSVNTFVVNLIEAMAIVIVLLCIFMGAAGGIMIGGILLLTIFGTFIVMNIMNISLQLISLGALILALGMLVDNAIVVTEGILVKTRTGVPRRRAALETVENTRMPLFGATLVAILAFAAIGTSNDSSGEFCGSLFKVMCISLALSWLLAVTLTPLFCIRFLKSSADKGEGENTDPYKGKFFQRYRGFLQTCLKHRYVTVFFMLLLLAISIYGFTFVKSSFFPKSSRPQFMIDYWKAEGSHIMETSADLEQAEKWISEHDNVKKVDTFVGQGALRFLLNYDPELPDSSYGQLLVTVKDYSRIDSMIPRVREYLKDNFPSAETKVKKFVRGPGTGADIEARFRGPDREVLRELSMKARDIMDSDPAAVNIRDDWRQKSKVVRPVVAEAESRRLGITRPIISRAVAVSFSGKDVGLYRENDELLPIMLKVPENERKSVDAIKSVQVESPVSGRSVPLSAIVKDFSVEWEDSIIRREDRQRTITAQCDPVDGPSSVLFSRLRPQLEKIDLPPGYSLEFGGEYENSSEARANLLGPVPLFFAGMVLVVIMLFNAIRQPLIIFLCIPLALIGVTAGLLAFNQPFGFMSLLGFLSLSGMIIKNAVVLIDQIDVEIRNGKDTINSILDSSVSRLRPVLMASMTTVLGMTPLVFDPFYRGMSVTIMGGLTFGTVLTLIVVPVLYSIFFGSAGNSSRI